jgi:hypothetical protein
MRVAPAPPRASMRREAADLKQQRVHIDWLTVYLLPHELEAVARVSVFAGSFTADGAAAVGCCVNQPELQQVGRGSDAKGCDQQHKGVLRYEDVQHVLRGLVQMSVLWVEGLSLTGGHRFSTHPLIRELGRELRCGQFREACGTEGAAAEVLMVQWMVADTEGPGGRLAMHKPNGSRPDIRVCQGVMAEEGANFREAARLLGSAGETGVPVEDVGLLADMLDIADVMSQLGYMSQTRQLEAVVVSVMTRVLGPEHPHTLAAMTCLASTLSSMGDLQESQALKERVVLLRTRLLGPDHQHTLLAMGNLATTLHSMGDLKGARELEERVVDGRARLLGSEHPDTLAALANFASTMADMGDLAGARQLQETVVGVSIRVLGPEHPDTLIFMSNLAATLNSMGDLSLAREVEEEVLAVHTRVLGPEHPGTLTSMANVAVALGNMGDLQGERDLENEVLLIQCRVLGPEHPDTLTTMANLAETLSILGDLQGACTLGEKVVGARSKVLGPDHPDTIRASIDLYSRLGQQGDSQRARQLLEGSAATAARLLGTEHPVTQHAMECTRRAQDGKQQGRRGPPRGVRRQRLVSLLGRLALPVALPLLGASIVASLLRGRSATCAAG